MAIVNQKEKIEKVEAVEVDINEIDVEGVESDFDLSEDWQAEAAPPPGRTDVNKPKLYKMRLFLDDGEKSFNQNTKFGFKFGDPNGVYFTTQLICKIQDATGEWQDAVGYFKLSTAILRGKKISSMAGVLRDLKVKVPARATDGYIAKLLFKALEKLDGPVMIGDCDWSAWDKTKTGKRAEFGATAILSNGKPATSMANFPKKAGGGHEHIAYTKDGLKVIAKLKVLKLVPLKEKEKEEKEVKEEVKKVVAPTAKAKAKPEVVEEVVETDGVVLDDDGEVVIEL